MIQNPAPPGLRWRQALLPCLALSMTLGLWNSTSRAAAETAVGGEEPAPEAQAGREVASGTATVLNGGEALRPPQLELTVVSDGGDVVQLNDLVSSKPTVLFYFSAGCPHCEVAAPDIVRLQQRLGESIGVINIASGSNTMSAATEFAERFGLGTPVYKDFSRQFASRNQATSTPTVLVVRKTEEGLAETLAEFRPFAPGISLLVEMRIRVLSGEDPWASFEPGHYYGPKACGGCHLGEYMSWGLNHHAVAYWTLYQRQRAEDVACVGCHVTGMGEPSGFVLGEHGSPLADVSCEACHGPGGRHGGAQADAGASCVRCHDKDHSVRFDLARALPHIDHHAAAAMSPEAYREARQKLLDGGAARPLTAFPKGKNLGAEACRECHTAEHSHWQKTPHAAALKTLKKRGAANNMSCLPCHAVEKRAAELPSDYYSDAVSCESCHGPGEEHVAAGGGTDNILALGSSCPECIIDAVCTRCHTPEHDPDWQLMDALSKVRHP